MMFKTQITLIVLLITISISAQEKDNILFSIDKEPVYSSEFIRVFQKNKEIIVENNQNNFDSYFDLFVDFKLKLKQAYELRCDTTPTYIAELNKYKEQLIAPYLQNSEATESLVKEAYQRTTKEINASHILIRVKANAKPKDTLLAFQKIIEARTKALKTTSFKDVAKQYSEDPSAQTNGGNLGYFTAFSMVYVFENAAFNTKKGEISQPFRTQFGYHILKVNDIRDSQGEIQVAHIMVKPKPDNTTLARKNIDDIYNKLKQGGDFAKIAQEHSDDTGSAKKGGVLPRFKSGKMIKPFDSIAFSLTEIGDFSSPFQSSYGWHIVKLLKRYSIQNLEEVYDQLENKIKNGSRSKYVQKSFAQKLEKQYKISENLEIISMFYTDNIDEMKSNKKLITIEDKFFTANDFYIYTLNNKNKNIGELYDDFKNKKIIDYYKNNLEHTNKEFAVIYKEYKDGLLLFELLQKMVWEKAKNDTISLEKYYENNKSKYNWKKRGNLTIASCTSLDKANWVKKYLEKNKSIDEIKGLMNEGATIHVLFSEGTLEEGNSKLPKDFKIVNGVSKIYNEKDNEYTIIKVDKTIPITGKTFKEIKGQVINDYQMFLEKQWAESLRKKYKVKVNKRILKKLKSQYTD
ncbi:MAG: peptidylprolyl isomerase [Flavobacteriaceae bacterium]|nr:peptidylprolyl isomerase [Flavobacteriaceae bacterium]